MTNILDLIGNTPLMNIDNIYFKMEMMNPSGSIKDRIVKEMILPHKDKDATFIEVTSGNTGISLAMICAVLNKRCTILCPRNTSQIKIKLMQMYGADLIFVNDIKQGIELANEHVNSRYDFIYLDQFNNPLNFEAQKIMAIESYYKLTEEPIWVKPEFFYKVYKNDNPLPNAIVSGVGTGGTLMGLHNVFPDAEIYEVVALGEKPIEGLCDGVKTLVPDDLKRNSIGIYYKEAKQSANTLMKAYGIACGISSGANYLAAYMIRKKYKRILTVFPDNNIRYW